MGNYKITNITKNLDKRSPNYNSTLSLEYPDGMIKKFISIKPDQQIVMILSTLPQSIIHLRIGNMIMVEEINEIQVIKLLNKEKPMEKPVDKSIGKKIIKK